MRKKADLWKIHKDNAYSVIQNVIIKNPKLKRLKPKSIKIKNQKTRWGSCSSKRNLNFNYRLVRLPYELAEYLVIHEFCHLKEMNHSKKYWTLVSNLSPNYKALQKELKKFSIK